MVMGLKKAKTDGKIYDIVDLKDYSNSNNRGDLIAVEWNGHIYPERNNDDSRPGIYNPNWGSYLVEPVTDEEKSIYGANNIIDFKSANIKELIEKSNTLKDMEREILTNPDNIFIPKLMDNDTPEMRLLKEAVTAKQIDIEKYESRFDGNFNNDKRLLFKPSITMGKMKSIADHLDMKITIIIEDKNPNVPNPMGKVITAELIGGEYNE